MKYTLTDEHRAQLPAWRDKWIANAMNTTPMDDEDRKIMRGAIKGLYESTGLKAPPENRIVFVPSPFVARFAGGFAAAIWYNRKNKKQNMSAATDDATRVATDDATRAATDDATYAATYAATYDATDDATHAATRAATRAATDDATYAATHAATRAATRAATDDATRVATRAATYDATDDATRAATYAATDAATRVATRDATRAATDDATRAATHAATRAATYAATRAARLNKIIDKNSWYQVDIKSMIKINADLKLGDFGLKCSIDAYKMYQGGNFWSACDSFLSFFRHVAKLPLDYSKYDHWEKAAQHGSYRIMHDEFCIISDRPVKLIVDAQNRPHCFDGPYCQWSDGSALYSIHGIRVPAWICETPASEFTKEMILGETNADYRRCIIQKIGIEKTIELLGAEVVDTYESSVGGKYELLMIDYTNTGVKRPYLKMQNPSLKDVIHIEGVGPNCKSVKDAICFRNGLKKFIEPKMLS